MLNFIRKMSFLTLFWGVQNRQKIKKNGTRPKTNPKKPKKKRKKKINNLSVKKVVLGNLHIGLSIPWLL